MRLSPREVDHLTLHQVGALAQKRLARGVRLNYPEAVALIASVVLELIRDGRSVSELMALGASLLGRRQVMPGVPALIHDVQVEGTFPDGTKLVTVHHPIAAEHGDLAMALYGSFLPVPDSSLFDTHGEEVEPGALRLAEGSITLNAHRPVQRLRVTNTSDRPIQVGSHFHFGETNPYLRYDRVASFGHRLNIPAGTAVRFEPGEAKTVELVPIAGERVIRGGNALADGAADDPEVLARYRSAVAERGFANTANAEGE
ncbi:MAG: urease subunit gamma [Planctomycetota bacterium]|nr:MAG: urease subunit gamma [Planctomycetota bacterium]